MEARRVLSSQWEQLYQAAIEETDLRLLSQRIVSAERAISDRIDELDSNPDSAFGERQALANASIMLQYLCSLAGERQGSLKDSMIMQDKKPPRSWRLVAREACVEQDPRRLSDLIDELNKILEKELIKQFRVSA